MINIESRLTHQFNEQFGSSTKPEEKELLEAGLIFGSNYQKWGVEENEYFYRLILGRYSVTEDKKTIGLLITKYKNVDF